MGYNYNQQPRPEERGIKPIADNKDGNKKEQYIR